MVVVVFNWRAVPLVFGSLVAGGGSWWLLAAMGVPPSIGAALGLEVAALIMIAFDYFRWRRRDPDASPPPWRLIHSPAAAHVLFVPCWLWGAIGALVAGLGLSSLLGGVVLRYVALAAGIAIAAAVPAYDWLRPFDRFRWAKSAPTSETGITPTYLG